MEIWKDIPGWHGVYQVSDQGRVRSVTRTIKGSRPCQPFRTMKGRIIKAHLAAGHGGEGRYLMVHLSAPGGRIEAVYVHHAVLLAFVGPRPPTVGRPEIRHLDGAKLNCWLENLRYGNIKENTEDRIRHRLFV